MTVEEFQKDLREWDKVIEYMKSSSSAAGRAGWLHTARKYREEHIQRYFKQIARNG